MDDLSLMHARYLQQAAWTRSLRDYLFGRIGIGAQRRILEVGSGTGAITAELHWRTQAEIAGVDISGPAVEMAMRNDPATRFIQADGRALPFASDSFDLCLCHFFLLWVGEPARALSEMRRVTRPGGWVLALAEPDYGGRIDYPSALEPLGRLQAQALARLGADPQMGRQLGALFSQAGLGEVQAGVLGGEWRLPPAEPQDALEWQVLAADLQDQVSAQEMSEFQRIDSAARQAGERILFVPTFYAIGRVK